MNSLQVTKLNESFSLIQGTTQELMKISDFYKVERDGQYFDVMVKRGLKSPYDFFTKGVDYKGQKALLIMNGLLMLHPVLSKFIKEEIPETSVKDVNGLLESLKGVLPFDPYDYQKEALIDILTNKKKSLARACTGCLDPESEIEVTIDGYYKKITYKELHNLLERNIKIKVKTPNGPKEILNKYTKTEPGKLIKYDDGTETRCAISHQMMFPELKAANEIKVNDSNGIKTVISIDDLPEQTWYDFEINCPDGLYYQNDIVHHNSGKSILIQLIQEYFRRENKKGILLVPNVNLLEQFYNDIKDYNLIDLANDTELIGGDYSVKDVSELTKTLTISTWQSMQNFEGSLEGLDFVMQDECHRFASEVTSDIVQKTVNAEFKYGFTGTLPDDKSKMMTLLGLFGAPKTYIRTQELIELGLGTPLRVNSIILQYSDETKNKIKKLKRFPSQFKFLREYGPRNEFITNLSSKLKGNSLILFSMTDHGKDLFLRIFKSKFPEVPDEDIKITGRDSYEFQKKYGVYFINGEDDQKTREKTRLILEDSEGATLVQNYQVLSTGVNIRKLHNLVLASPLKSFTTISQSIGRLVRLHESKSEANIYDIVDDLGTRTFTGPFWRQYQERLAKSYNPENIPVIERVLKIQ